MNTTETRLITPDAFATRHGFKGKDSDISEDYPGLSIAKLDTTALRVQDLLTIVEGAPDRAIIHFGLTSEVNRTSSTSHLYVDRLRNATQDREDIVVLHRSQLAAATLGIEGEIEANARKEDAIFQFIKGNPDQKIIIDDATYHPGFRQTVGRWFKDWEGKILIDFYSPWVTPHGEDEYQSFPEWFDGQVDLTGAEGIEPNLLAQQQIAAYYDLREKTQKLVDGRFLITGGLGHSLNLDAVLAYAAGKGKVSMAAFEAIAQFQGQVKETELVQMNLDPMSPTRLSSITFRGKTVPAI